MKSLRGNINHLPSFGSLVLAPFRPGGQVVRERVEDDRSSVSKLERSKEPTMSERVSRDVFDSARTRGRTEGGRTVMIVAFRAAKATSEVAEAFKNPSRSIPIRLPTSE